MKNLNQDLRFQRRPEILDIFGISNTTLDSHVRVGLMTPPISAGERARAWINYETKAIQAARIIGKTDNEIKNLVTSLIEKRKELYSKYACAEILEQEDAA